MDIDEKLLAAIIGGAVSLIIAILSQWLGPRSQRSIERLKVELSLEAEEVKKGLERQSEALRNEFTRNLEELKGTLSDRNSASAARRDYEYEARKRLYTEVEPILFQLYESLEEAHYRVRSLARSSRAGNLGGDEKSWLAHEGYYLRSTIYKLSIPAVYLRLIQRRITFVDLGLDPTIRLRYLLLKLYSRSFTDDFVFASLDPKLPYDPNHEDWAAQRKDNPSVYSRQALVVGDLENIADGLLKVDEGAARPLLFAEFELLLEQQKAEDDSLQELVHLFLSFSPANKPILARLLTSQAYLAQLILSTYHGRVDADGLLQGLEALLEKKELRAELDWGDPGGIDAGPDQARAYLRQRLEWLQLSEARLEPNQHTELRAPKT
jgi:hypothetical protein